MCVCMTALVLLLISATPCHMGPLRAAEFILTAASNFRAKNSHRNENGNFSVKVGFFARRRALLLRRLCTHQSFIFIGRRCIRYVLDKHRGLIFGNPRNWCKQVAWTPKAAAFLLLEFSEILVEFCYVPNHPNARILRKKLGLALSEPNPAPPPSLPPPLWLICSCQSVVSVVGVRLQCCRAKSLLLLFERQGSKLLKPVMLACTKPNSYALLLFTLNHSNWLPDQSSCC